MDQEQIQILFTRCYVISVSIFENNASGTGIGAGVRAAIGAGIRAATGACPGIGTGKSVIVQKQPFRTMPYPDTNII